jgi:lipopolysaccharide transport system permease protein
MLSENERKIWTREIKPVSGWFDINIKELWNYRDLVMLFFKRNFIVMYKQTILGPLWFLLQPLLTTIMFTIIFSWVAKLPTSDTPPILFYMSGTILWSFFSTCVTANSKTFTDNANIFSKVYFPRLVMPISVVLSNLLNLFIQLLLFVAIWIYYKISGRGIELNNNIFLFPLLIIQIAMLGLSVGIIISSLTTKYRDLAFVATFGIQLWMYASPVVYPLSLVPDRFKIFILLNPMTMVIEAFRSSVFGTSTINMQNYMLSFMISIFLFIFSIMLFSRIEKTFIDRV